MDRKRLALERATTVYMEEGPVPANDFRLEGGPPGCQSDSLVTNGGKAGVAHPKWTELINGNKYKIIFDLPQDVDENIKKDAAAILLFINGRWNCRLPDTRFHAYNSHSNGGSGDTKNKIVSCFGFVMTYDEDTGQFSVTDANLEASKEVLGSLSGINTDAIAGRAEYVNPIERLGQNSGNLASIVQAPCTVKWSNSYQIDPTIEGGQCLYFVGASAGDFFVMFSVIPRDKTTWFHLQISLQGVALYKGMKLVKYEEEIAARGLGASNLFQPYFICLDEESSRTYIKYGIGSDTSEKGKVYLFYDDENPPLGIRYYSFGSGEANVEIMDARVIEGSKAGDLECTGYRVMKNGKCVVDCHPECDGCIPPKTPGSELDTECRRCKHFTIDKNEGGTKCVPDKEECPPSSIVDPIKKTCKCPGNKVLSVDGKACTCPFTDVDQAGKTICVLKCPDMKKPNGGSQSPKCVCKFTYNGVCVSKCPIDTILDGNKCKIHCQIGNGISYRGTVSVTISGKTCDSWSRYSRLNSWIPAEVLKDKNYCRNPAGERNGVWCYANVGDNPYRAEECFVPRCGCYDGTGASHGKPRCRKLFFIELV
ncbi:uncharacterized protein LOC118405293 [Branchiostoma floridae]|uniref:Uncharacterized protein LOC118405293 n=1 Tax=Branchiostoma floridae TaxID=7739 RepID=A0A9J7KIH6_BRAFL|nr:uncharacterized protein LOC118405293 [Branchiostoma floridae]